MRTATAVVVAPPGRSEHSGPHLVHPRRQMALGVGGGGHQEVAGVDA